ncbi:MAG: phosphatidate phosphatase APP1 [Myxococcota bacterium]|jgi:phosphatidate phosphatase APP1
MSSPIKADETVHLFPTIAHRSVRGWQARIHAWVHEDGVLSGAMLSSLRRTIGLAGVRGDREIFRRRGAHFLVDNERDKALEVTINGETFVLPSTGANGHTALTVTLPPETPAGHHTMQVNTEDGRTFSGALHLVPPEGISVISDIDDTIKITDVHSRREMLANTFFRPFAPAPGMAAVYQRLAAEGARFHYVSSSPWQLYPELYPWLSEAGYPAGSMHLKLFRAKDRSLLNLLKPGTETKPLQIAPLLQALPQRQFILIGDSGEQDPEVYGALARRHDQIACIYIRNVSGESREDPRIQSAFAELHPERWALFTDPEQIGTLKMDPCSRP